MAKITLHGMFARVKGKFNKSETLYFKGCPCGKEQLGVDLLNPSKAKDAKNIQAQSKYTSLFGYTVAQKYVNPFGN